MTGFDAILRRAAAGPPQRVAVAGAASPSVLHALREATERGIIQAILVGPGPDIRAAAAAAGGASMRTARVVPSPGDDAAGAALAVAEVATGRADVMMKGTVATASLLHAVLDAETGLRAGRRLSHVAVVSHPGYPRLMLHTDGGINHHLDDGVRRDLLRNAVQLARGLGVAAPRVACLALVEKVDPHLPDTQAAADLAAWAAAALPGVVAEGPLGIDMAYSAEAAAIKGLPSQVAGCADIFVHPAITTCNFAVKSLVSVAGARAAGVVLGARAPIVLLSRADDADTRLLSLAVAAVGGRSARSAGAEITDDRSDPEPNDGV